MKKSRKTIIWACIAVPLIILLAAAITGIMRADELIPDDITYKVVEKQLKPNHTKAFINIYLNKKTDTLTVYKISKKKYRDYDDFENVIFRFFVQSDTTNLWASTEFTPDYRSLWLDRSEKIDTIIDLRSE